MDQVGAPATLARSNLGRVSNDHFNSNSNSHLMILFYPIAELAPQRHLAARGARGAPAALIERPLAIGGGSPLAEFGSPVN